MGESKPSAAGRAATGRSGARSVLRQYAEALLLAALLALLVRAFVVQAFKIPSTSMVPTLLVGDHLLVNKLCYGISRPLLGGWLVRWGAPQPGEIVVFVPPVDRNKPFFQRRDFIKRVAAVAGEKVEIRDGRLFVDGRPRPLPRADPPTRNGGMPPQVVPAGHVFVVGDNRDASEDSRSFGSVPLSALRGRASVVYWSWDPVAERVRWERLGEGL